MNRLITDAYVRKFDCLPVWKLDRFGRSLVDCLNNIRTLEEHGIQFIAVTQGLDTDQKNPASRFLLYVLGAAAEFEQSLIRERTQAGQMRYRQDFEGGRVVRRCIAVLVGTCPLIGPKRFSTGKKCGNSGGRACPSGRSPSG